MKKILTISIAAYNVEKFIRHTLDSLIVPDIMDKMEVLIIDDGGTDGTLAIAQEYEKKYPNTFYAVHKENGGYGSTVNYSISYATGKYLKLLDGDDWFCTENLQNFIRFLEEQDADIVLSPYYREFTEENRRLFIDKNKLLDGTQNLKDVPIEGILIMHQMCIKTKLFQNQNKRITEHCFYTDYEYVFLSLLQAQTITRFNLPIYCYQIGIEGQSVSIAGIRKYYIDKTKVSLQMYKWYSEQEKNIFKGNHHAILVREMLGITDDAYLAYMTLPDVKQGKKELIEFDKSIKKNFPDIYKLTMSIKKIKLLRKTNFLTFNYLRKRYLKSL